MSCRGLVGLLVDVCVLQGTWSRMAHMFAREGSRTWDSSGIREDEV